MQIAFLFWTYLVMDNPIKTQYIERTGAGGNAEPNQMHSSSLVQRRLSQLPSLHTPGPVKTQLCTQARVPASASPKPPPQFLLSQLQSKSSRLQSRPSLNVE